MTLMKPWEIHNPLYMLVGGPNAEYGGNRWYDKTLQVRPTLAAKVAVFQNLVLAPQSWGLRKASLPYKSFQFVKDDRKCLRAEPTNGT